MRLGRARPKKQSIYQIGQILSNETGGDERLKFDTLEQYSTTLDRVEALAWKSVQHGDRITGNSVGK